jgi:hypothetical protein
MFFKLLQINFNLKLDFKFTFSFASAKDCEEKRQSDVDEVGGVFFLPLSREILQKFVDDRNQLTLVGGLEGLQPGVQGPGYPQVSQIESQIKIGRFTRVVHGLL